MTETSMEGASDLRSNHGPAIPEFARELAQYSVSGPIPPNRQLVMILPNNNFDMEKDVVPSVARGIQC